MRLETDRLVLRRFDQPGDRDAFAAICADAEVMEWLGGTLTRAEADARVDRVEASWEANGHGRFLVERKADGAFLGWSGIMPAFHTLPIAGVPEMGWRLVRHAWGQGYATEAAAAAIADGFGRLGFPEIWAFTNPGNLRSQAVMRRLGMTRRSDLDFDYPDQPRDGPLRHSMVYVAQRP
ncbi:GNAT family N-acetyltransferase [Phenylobacterium sp.]|uniref:GNAT family N-acetyltransferase n=1 Tax=Phenylobacterium sp. TaxID=1871053 RepID=UPI002FCAD9CA